MASGISLLSLFPGLTSEEPPAFIYLQSGIGGAVDFFIQGITGDPKTLFSVYSGEQVPVDFLTGVTPGSFDFNGGKLTIGRGETDLTPTATGDLNIFYTDESPNCQAGFIVHDTSQLVGSGKPVSLYRTSNDTDYLEKSSILSRRAQFKSNLGGYKTQLLPGPMAYEAVNVFSNSNFTEPVVDGANEPLAFAGYGFGRFDGASNLYSNLNLYKEYAEIGHFLQTSTKENIGGAGSMVLRHTPNFPTSAHSSGTVFYSAADHSLNVITSDGQGIKLAPGITGINQFAHSSAIYTDLAYSTITPGVQRADVGINMDGKIAVNANSGINYQIRFISGLPDGFSCSILHGSGAGQGTFTAQTLNLIGSTRTPGKGELSFANVYGGKVYLTHSRPVEEINLFPRDFISSITSGAATGFFQTSTNKASYQCFDFDQSTPASIEASVDIPATWQSLDCEIYYLAQSGVAFTDSRWNVSAKYDTPFASIDGVFSTPVVFQGTINDTNEITSATNLSDVSILPSGIDGGSAGYDKSFLKLKISRDASSISDSMNATARFLGATLRRR
jgi:hypothetical protein